MKKIPGLSALRHRKFVLFWAATVSGGFAAQIMGLAVALQIYDLTHSTFLLGMVGLALFLPALLLVFVTGLVADRMSRRVIMALCMGLEALSAGGFLVFTATPGASIGWLFVILVVLGFARAFFNPASDALMPNLVPKIARPNAISFNSMGWQLSSVLGPVAGGILFGISPFAAYGTAMFIAFAAGLLALSIGHVPQRKAGESTSFVDILAGVQFIIHEPVVLGAITLDMFAVLLGGAVSLLPVYGKDILHVDVTIVGIMRGAPGVGAILMALWLSRKPIQTRAGLKLFIGVAVFALATIVFGFSTSVPLSMAALFVMGGADMISVYIRQTLLQLRTPDAVRGRVNAVNRVFIGASNEIGEFRAGTVAAWWGAVPTVVVGGLGTLCIAAVWPIIFPALLRSSSLVDPSVRDSEGSSKNIQEQH